MIHLVSPSQSAFAESSWLALYDHRLRVLQWKDEFVCAEMFVFETNKWGYRTLITPPYMPHTQLKIVAGKSLEEFIQQLEQFLQSGKWSYCKFDFPVGYQLAVDFPTTLKQVEKYTYRIEDLTHWRVGATSKLRNDINKLDRYSFAVESAQAKHVLFFISKLKEVGLTHLEIIQRAQGNAGFYFVEEEEGKYVACCTLQDGVVYYLAAANEKSDRTVATCGLAYCIDEALRKGARIFDFEGSMIPGVEAYFKKFGGRKVHYLSLSLGKGWKYRIRRMIGK